MRYAQIRQYDINNGDGIACSLFVVGCNFLCPNCFNKAYQDFNYGEEWTREVEDKFIEMCKNPQVDHIAILGGEPLQQDDRMGLLLYRLKHEVKKPIWLWTGYTFEELNPKQLEWVMDRVDYLIDGRFVESLKDMRLKFRGSSNQRVINIKESLQKGEVVLCDV